MSGAELLARIASNPDDEDPYLVYADYLTEQDDPHGELIVLMHQLDHAKTDEDRAHLGNALDAYMVAQREALFGDVGGDDSGIITWDFHLGFLRSVHVLTPGVHLLKEMLPRIVQRPIARFLRELRVFDTNGEAEGAVAASIMMDKPRTLEGVTFAKRYDSVRAALAAGDAVEWLDVNVDDLPAKVAKLRNLEWLRISGLVQRLPKLDTLTKLRRLDLEQCWALPAFPEEAFAIESLRHVSMHGMNQLQGKYHMGRINHLLGGFARARTPARRRKLELDLLLGREPKATRADLLAALDNNVGVVREAAMRALEVQLPAVALPRSGGSYALVGKTNLDKKQITDIVGARGGKLTTKIDEQTTHVILGLQPRGKQAAIGDLPIVFDRQLNAAAPAAPKSDLDPVRAALRSRDEAQTAAAVKDLAFDPALLLDLVIVAQDTKLATKTRTAAKKLLALNAPAVDAAMKQHLKTSLLLETMSEQLRRDRIAEFGAASKLDSLELAMLLLRRARVGTLYAIVNGSSDDIVQALRIVNENSGQNRLELTGAHLAELPAEVARFSNLDTVILDYNRFEQFPTVLLELPELRSLSLRDNALTTLPPEIAKLPLVTLDIASNRWHAVPRAVFDITTLETLDVSGHYEYFEHGVRMRVMTPELGRLTRLRVLRCHNTRIDGFPDALWTLPLEELSLMQCTLPDEVPRDLAKLKQLRTLDIRYTEWQGKRDELVRLLPGCEIVSFG